MSFVRFIHDLTGTPNDAKWNSVLFGGNNKIIDSTFLNKIMFLIGIIGSLFFLSSIFFIDTLWCCIRSLWSKANASTFDGTAK